MNEVVITNTNGKLTVSSLQIAESFEKQHKDVIKSIDFLIKETSAKNFANLFIESSYTDSYGRHQKCYELTRDGFSLLVMGFTGKKALEWKLKYIEAFNLMEKQLSKNHSNFNLEELITKTVSVAVSETIKAIMPMLEKPAPDIISDVYDPEPPSRRTHSIISKLDTELRTAVDDMILSRKYTYEEIKEFLAEQGVAVSMSSIQRYKTSLYRKDWYLWH